MSLHSSLTRIPMLTLLACLAFAAFAAGESEARDCGGESVRQPNGSGYFTSLAATRISCSYGKSFRRSHWRCRTNSGSRPAGRCARVRGFRCSERRNSIPTEIDARVTCRRGSQKIVYTYSQPLGD